MYPLSALELLNAAVSRRRGHVTVKIAIAIRQWVCTQAVSFEGCPRDLAHQCHPLLLQIQVSISGCTHRFILPGRDQVCACLARQCAVQVKPGHPQGMWVYGLWRWPSALGHPDQQSRCVPAGLAGLLTPASFMTPTSFPLHDAIVTNTASRVCLPPHGITVLGGQGGPISNSHLIKMTV